VLGHSLIQHLTECADEIPTEPGEGALVEFDVTPAQGMSPALAKVVAAVRDRFLLSTTLATFDAS
jgi:hypothetical protein